MTISIPLPSTRSGLKIGAPGSPTGPDAAFPQEKPHAPARRLGSLHFETAFSPRRLRSLALALLAPLGMALAQQSPPPPPTLRFHAVADFFQLPADMYLGEAVGVGVNSHGDIFVLNRGDHPIIEFNAQGRFVRTIGDHLYGFVFPHALRVDPQDDIWAIDEMSNMVVEFDPQGRVKMLFGRRPEPPGGAQHTTAEIPWIMDGPTDVAFGPEGQIYITDGYHNSRVVEYDRDGRWVRAWGSHGAGPGQFDVPHAMVADAQGRLYVADRTNQRIEVFDGTGKFLAQWNHIGKPFALCITAAPHQVIFDAEERSGLIRELDLNGKVLGTFGHTGKLPGEFGWVHGLACAPDNVLYTAEILTWRSQKIVVQRP